MKKIILLLTILLSANTFAQTDCIQVPDELKKLIKHPTLPADLHSSQQLLASRNSQATNSRADFLVEFNNAFKNRGKASQRTLQNNQVIFDAITKKAKKDPRYIVLSNMVKNSNSVSNLRDKLKKQIRLTRDTETLNVLVLFDYQVQILDSYHVFDRKIRPLSSKGGPNTYELVDQGWADAAWDIFMGAAAGATLGAEIGGVGCTFALPVVGTVACGVVGAVVGGVAGAVYTAVKD